MATISFFRREDNQAVRASRRATFDGDVECPPVANLSLEKRAEYDGQIAESLTVDTTDLESAELANLPIAFHLRIKNSGCGAVQAVTIVDSLPRGFVVDGVDIEDLGAPSAVSILTGLVIIPAIAELFRHKATSNFDDIAYDIKRVGHRDVLVVAIKMDEDGLGENDFVDLRVSGRLRVPQGWK